MVKEVLWGIGLPFWGTALGAAAVLVLRRKPAALVKEGLCAFAAGVMLAASIWSLILPAIGQSGGLGRWAFVPAVAGVWLGVLGLLGLNRLLPEGQPAESRSTTLLVLAVVLHNLPEGMAVGVVYAARLAGLPGFTAAGALALATGIALQNLPEGAIVSLPLRAEGKGRGRSFVYGVLSGAVEPLGAALTLAAARQVEALLPLLLSFAAGAMLFVTVAELIPEMSRSRRPGLCALLFTLGFTVMLALDVALS